MIAKRISLLAMVAASVLLAGCLFSPEEDNGGGGGGGDDELPFPGSPQQLMENFETVYEGRDYNGYLTVMDPQFRIFLKQETVTEFGLPRDFFEYAEEIVITEKMFSGNPPSEDVGAISNIDFVTLRQIDDWNLTENTEFPEALESAYDVDFRIMQSTSDGEKQLNIKGRIIFFLSSEQVEYQGRTRTKYRMVGQIDETNAS